VAVATVNGWDATGANLHAAPLLGQSAGYITGSEGVPWSPAQQAAHKGFVQIDQSPIIAEAAKNPDMYDLENGAVTLGEIAGLVKTAQQEFRSVARPGQRWPGVYCSREGDDGVTPVVNALLAGGVMSCPLGIADYNFDVAQAQFEVANSSGPFPVVWRQYSDKGAGGLYDLDVFSVPWLQNVSSKVPTTTTQSGWRYCNKCLGLFYSPNKVSAGVCPAGGTHNPAQSGDYSLQDTH
jgi:hypothetical protein